MFNLSINLINITNLVNLHSRHVVGCPRFDGLIQTADFPTAPSLPCEETAVVEEKRRGTRNVGPWQLKTWQLAQLDWEHRCWHGKSHKPR